MKTLFEKKLIYRHYRFKLQQFKIFHDHDVVEQTINQINFVVEKVRFRNQIQNKQFQFCRCVVSSLKLRTKDIERYLFINILKKIAKYYHN